MDRLLNEQEIERALGNRFGTEKERRMFIAKAQLAKTDEEWGEWVKGIESDCVVTNDNGQCSGYPDCKANLFSPSCNIWQERKRSVGL